MVNPVKIAPIQSEHVRLRLLTEADLPLTLAWRNRPEIRCWFFHSQEISWEQHLAWFAQYTANPHDFVFIIEDLNTGQPVGQVALYYLDEQARRCEYGRLMMGEDAARGKGLAKQATLLLCKWGFERLGVDEIYLEVLENNLAARAVYTACGFELEDIREGTVYMTLYREKAIE